MTCSTWPVQWPKKVDDIDEDLVVLAIDSAQELLWAKTGRRFGTCSTTEWYRTADSASCIPTPYKSIVDGEWRNGYPGVGGMAIDLVQQPVRSITEVQIAGVTLDPSRYYLDRNSLMSVDSPWPGVMIGQEPVIRVSYVYGEAPTSILAMAMGELAWEFLQGFQGLACRLPSNATSITRQGVTITLADPQVIDEAGLLGLPLCDAAIRATNPNKLSSRSRIYSPDVPRRTARRG